MTKTRNYIIALAILGLILIGSKVNAAKIIADFEGLKLKAYQDSAGIWTIGYGNTRNPYTGLPIKKGDTITKKEALDWLNFTTAGVQTQVKKFIKVPVNDRQLAALTSLAYNIGNGAFSRSTLLRLLNSGADKETVAAQFIRWNKVKGIVVPGLTRRRKLEADLFLT
jgi:lysozyme